MNTLDILAAAKKLDAPHEFVAIIDAATDAFRLVKRSEVDDPQVGTVVAWTIPTVTETGLGRTYARILLELPEPHHLTCEKCEEPARVILSRRTTHPDAPVHPRCAKHLYPGCAATIDQGAV